MTASRPPRLLMPVHSAKRAGAQLVALGQARALAHDHDLVVAIGPGPLRPEFGEIAEIVRAPTRLPVWGASPLRWALELARIVPDTARFVLLIRRRGIDAVLTPSTILVAPVIAARLTGVWVIVQAQESPKSRAARALLRFHGRFADAVIAISPLLERALAGSRARIVMAYVGIPVPPRPSRPSRQAESPLALITVGTVDRHKRQDVAVRALAELVARGVDTTLSFVGAETDEEYATAVRAQIAAAGLEHRIQFTGQVDNVQDHLRAADVLLLPAGEVTPLVLMEAMACGTAVVAARTGSVADVVGDGGETGLLVPEDDPVAMAAAVHCLAAAPELAEAIVRRARLRVEEQFDERHAHGRVRELVADVLAHRATQKRSAATAVVRA